MAQSSRKTESVSDQEWHEETEGAAANADDEWGNEVESELQFKLDTLGDVFTGVYLGMDPPMKNTGIVQAHFNGTGEFAGSAYFTNAGRDLQRKLAKVPEKREVRIELVDWLETGQPNPMAVTKVQWR